MIDKTAMRSLLKDMEQVAETTLQNDAAFYEALQALKWEIDNDPSVQAALKNLQATGHSVFSSFVPRIRVKIRTEEGILRLSKTSDSAVAPASGEVAKLMEDLRNAASHVIRQSRFCQELDGIVNEAVSACDTFESMASQIESAGHEVLISLDLSTYAQVHETSAAAIEPPRADRQLNSPEQPANLKLSPRDLAFLKELKISAEEYRQ